MTELFEHLSFSWESISAIVGLIAVIITAIPAVIKILMSVRERDELKPEISIKATDSSTVRGISQKTEMVVSDTGIIGFLIEPDAGRSFRLGREIVVGRAPSSDIVLDDQKVSNLHAKLEFDGEKFVISDLDSVNGTFVNGEKMVGRTPLHDDDAVSIGDQSFVFKTV